MRRCCWRCTPRTALAANPRSPADCIFTLNPTRPRVAQPREVRSRGHAFSASRFSWDGGASRDGRVAWVRARTCARPALLERLLRSLTHGQVWFECELRSHLDPRCAARNQKRRARPWRRNWRPAWRARSRRSSRPGRIRPRQSRVSRACRSFTARTPRRRGEVRDHTTPRRTFITSPRCELFLKFGFVVCIPAHRPSLPIPSI